MNGTFMRWLLDLDSIPADAEDLRLVWEHPLPAWLVVFLVLAVIAFAVWSYARLTGAVAARGALAAFRAVVILLAIALLAGPMLELPRETVEQDWVMMLVDRSASMSIRDAGPGTTRASRDTQLRTIIDGNATTWDTLAAERQVRWLGFHAGAFTLGDAAAPAPDEPAAASVIDLGEPTGERTDLSTALSQAMQRAAARPVSGVVVFSDGRTNDPPSRALVRRLLAEAIPVFVVPLGSPEPIGDFALRRVDAPRRAFVRDKVPVVVDLDRFGNAAGDLAGTIKLVDGLTGEVLDQVEVEQGDATERVTLTANPELAGEANWRVEIETTTPDLIPENNSKPFIIELVDRPLRVLYVEGYPRWEYRYLKNLLIREESIESSVMLLSADRDFAQEGNQPITRLPRSPEEFARYDVILLGDAPASFFAPDQLDMIRAHIADRGGGMLWIGGERHMPSSYAGTVLADLLPMRGSLELPRFSAPVTMQPTPLAERLGVLRLLSGAGVGWPVQLADASFGWSQLYYAQRIEPGRLKATAEVLAETTQLVDGAHYPLLAHIRYGAGQSIYCATDEIWRWRYGRGELFPDQFWIQMIRMLGRESLATGGEHAVLNVNPRRIEVNQPLRIDLRLLDTQLLDGRRGSITAVLETTDGRPIADLELRRDPEADDRFGVTFIPEVAGALLVRVTGLPGIDLASPVDVLSPNDELRRPETDHGVLAGLALSTGGRVLGADQVADLPQLLPNRSVRTLNPIRERIWDTPLFFLLVLLALTTEWIGRKIVRLM